MLRYSNLRDVALQELGEADLVVISLEDDARIPSEVINWISPQQVYDDDQPRGVVILWDREGENASELPIVCHSLRPLAKAKGLDLLYDGAEWAGENIGIEIRRVRENGHVRSSLGQASAGLR